MQVDFGKAWPLIENPATVTLKKKTAEGLYSSYAVSYTLPRAATLEDVVRSGAVLDGTYAVWHFWREKLDAAQAGLTPAIGDKIDDPDRGVFTIKEVAVHNRRQRFRVLARKDVAA